MMIWMKESKRKTHFDLPHVHRGEESTYDGEKDVGELVERNIYH